MASQANPQRALRGIPVSFLIENGGGIAASTLYSSCLDNFIQNFGKNMKECLSSRDGDEGLVLLEQLSEHALLYAMLVNTLYNKDLEMGCILLKVIEQEGIYPNAAKLRVVLKEIIGLEQEKLEGAAWHAKEFKNSGYIPVPDKLLHILDSFADEFKTSDESEPEEENGSDEESNENGSEEDKKENGSEEENAENGSVEDSKGNGSKEENTENESEEENEVEEGNNEGSACEDEGKKISEARL